MEISQLYNFNYICTYHLDGNNSTENWLNDLNSIISEENNKNVYCSKIYGIFLILDNNAEMHNIFEIIRSKITNQQRDKMLIDIILFLSALSSNLLYLIHPCICDIYYTREIKPENLTKLLEKLETISQID